MLLRNLLYIGIYGTKKWLKVSISTLNIAF